MSLPVSRAGLRRSSTDGSLLGAATRSAVVVAIEATGQSAPGLGSVSWSGAILGAVRLFAPSETKAARTQLGSGRFKTDDRDCAALTYLVRQGAGRALGR